jgi:hypothetical protein
MLYALIRLSFAPTLLTWLRRAQGPKIAQRVYLKLGFVLQHECYLLYF